MSADRPTTAAPLAQSDVPRPHSHFGRDTMQSDTQPQGDTAATAAIASVSDQDWYISRTHGVYQIPGRAKSQQYSLLLITSRGEVIDIGADRCLPFAISAPEIADDLLQELHDHGVFVYAGFAANIGARGVS